MQDLRNAPKASAGDLARLGISGVNFAGYLTTESGVGAASRGYVHALQSLGLDVALNNVSDLQVNRSRDASLALGNGGHAHDISMVCADVELHYAILDRLGDGFFTDRYNIGIWAWELPKFPEKWYDRFAFYDEVWVGTSFVADALAAVSPIPVVRIPPVVHASAPGSRDEGRRRLEVEENEYVFLFVFDYHSHDARKNPRATVEAFKLAFRPGDKVRLVIKCANTQSAPDAFAALQRCASGHPVTIIDGYWSADEMLDLMAAADAYVSLHRSEGTGLTIAEAMALGKPVIATGWSGNMDFMDVSNSFPVGYELTTLDGNVGPYSAGLSWAEPCIDDAATRMRQVFEARDEAAQRGLAARQTIEDNYSANAVAGLMARRLETIHLRQRLPRFRDEKWEAYDNYRQLTASISEVSARVLPENANVIVVSKGDDRLLRLGGRRASHFPCTDDGTYAGYYPVDSAQAIDHLEAMRARGAGFLLLPYTGYWWLDHYQEFARHLEVHYSRIWHDDKLMIYDIGAVPCLGSESRLADLKPLAARLDHLVHYEEDLRHRLLRAQPVMQPLVAPRSVHDQPASARLVAAYEAQLPDTWLPGETRIYALTLTNLGSETWNASGSQMVRLGVHFGGESDLPEDGWLTDQRFSLPFDIEPGLGVTLEVAVTAPFSEGSYVLRHRVVKEEVTWFEQILRAEIAVATPAPQTTPAPGNDWLLSAETKRRGILPGRLISYEQLVNNARDIVRTRLPEGAKVLIVTKGDAELLEVEGRDAQHFPQTESLDGTYAGYHPRDSGSAIEQLEALRRGGAEFFMLPGPSFWWLDFYVEFGAYLDHTYQRLWDDQDAIVYRLSKPEPPIPAGKASQRAIRSVLGKLGPALKGVRLPL